MQLVSEKIKPKFSNLFFLKGFHHQNLKDRLIYEQTILNWKWAFFTSAESKENKEIYFYNLLSITLFFLLYLSFNNFNNIS